MAKVSFVFLSYVIMIAVHNTRKIDAIAVDRSALSNGGQPLKERGLLGDIFNGISDVIHGSFKWARKFARKVLSPDNSKEDDDFEKSPDNDDDDDEKKDDSEESPDEDNGDDSDKPEDSADEDSEDEDSEESKDDDKDKDSEDKDSDEE